ncbi:MAG: hypothetical protein PHU07_03770 [Acidocella sp.]|nr:hypothetical protein [Acidocella sp.]
MYSESDIDAAIDAGALTPEAADKFRAYMAAQKTAPAVDEEYVRLLSGFNDIFVSIAIGLVIAATGVLTHGSGIAGLLIAAESWILAEYFTRRRRMALPSILLLLTYTGGLTSFAAHIVHGLLGAGVKLLQDGGDPAILATLAISAAAMAAATYIHWRRFRVPITIAAGIGSVTFFCIALLLTAVPGLLPYWPGLVFLGGVGTFALALRWDMSDRARQTRRSDVAFWLHLLAAPMLVHPVFHSLGLLHNSGASLMHAGLAIGIYLVLAVLALLVDRRALLVSGLAYVLAAFTVVLRASGFIGEDLALTGLVAGAALLLLSAFWHKARQGVLRLVPTALRQALPAV